MIRQSETAYAKINLALHVRKRRDDGYHELESLVVFLDNGDDVRIQAAEQDSLLVQGPFAASSGDIADNLVLRALQWARKRATVDIPPLSIELTKNLPVAAGLGGGSADAAALLRLLNIPNMSDLAPETAFLGADVPACLYQYPLIMRGIGEQIERLEDDSLRGISAVLVNPGVPVPTGPVFKAWDQVDLGGLPYGTALEIARSGRNDLQAPAITLCPAIGDVLSTLNDTNSLLARMSGSGASCFALYDDPQKAAYVEVQLQNRYPTWWVKAGSIAQCQ